MDPDALAKVLADIKDWIDQTLTAHQSQMQPVLSVGFPKLGRYYPTSFLQQVYRVVVDKCPRPPLSATGISGLAEIATWDLKGAPWVDTIFIRRDLADWDAVHFHELLHIVQFQHLGTDAYLTAWAIGTILRGYRENPLEEMAFRHQQRFESNNAAYNAVEAVKAELDAWPADYFDIRHLK